MKHIYDQHSDAVTTVRFAHNDDSTLVAASADGRYGSLTKIKNYYCLLLIYLAQIDCQKLQMCLFQTRISVCQLDEGGGSTFASLEGHTDAVLDLDISESNEFLVSCSKDGVVALWDLKTNALLRRTEELFVLFCRFLPKNNNLVVCGVGGAGGAVRLFNVSTGKFVAHVSSPVLGKSLCAEVRTASLIS